MVQRKICVYKEKEKSASLLFVVPNSDKNLKLIFYDGCLAQSEESKNLDDNFEKKFTFDAFLGIYERHVINAGSLSAYFYFIFVSGSDRVENFDNTIFYSIKEVTVLDAVGQSCKDDFFTDMKKLLTAENFYFAQTSTGSFDLTRHFTTQQIDDSIYSPSSNMEYLWNKSLLKLPKLMSIDIKHFFVYLIRGYIGSTVTLLDRNTIKCFLVSRISTYRTGARYISRGIDDNGHVSNFVETEFLVTSTGYKNKVISFKIIRGTIPLFWAQFGFQIGKHKITYTRPPNLSKYAAYRHFKKYTKDYEKMVIVSLLNNNEKELSKNYKNLVELVDKNMTFIDFNYHENFTHKPVKERTIEPVLSEINKLDFNEITITENGFVTPQKMIIRVNCIDCIDRTNSFQTEYFLAKIFTRILAEFNAEKAITDQFVATVRAMWISNGDKISKSYTGTDALGNKNNKLLDCLNSSIRIIQNNFYDQEKQNVVLGLLRESPFFIASSSFPAEQFIPRHLSCLPMSIQNEILNHFNVFCNYETLNFFLCTWNCGAWKKPDSSILDKIFNAHPDFEPSRCDVIVLGLEEIIDLNPQNVSKDVKIDSGWRKKWIEIILESINKTLNSVGSQDKFVCVKSTQLVGVCLFILMRKHLLPITTRIESSLIRTGKLGGTIANKGSVAIRLMIADTSFCFVCSHFASDEEKLTDRLKNYHETLENLNFLNGRLILNHDYIFWIGDFNFRLTTPKSNTDNIIQQLSTNNIDGLLELDELEVQRNLNKVFQGFNEAKIKFKPTYKYDKPNYESYSSQRIPAWCDRILWYCTNHRFDSIDKDGSFIPRSSMTIVEKTMDRCVNVVYGSVESVCESDHKPVYGGFKVAVRYIDHEKLSERLLNVLDDFGALDGIVKFVPRNSNDIKKVLDIVKVTEPNFTRKFPGEIHALYRNLKRAKIYAETQNPEYLSEFLMKNYREKHVDLVNYAMEDYQSISNSQENYRTIFKDKTFVPENYDVEESCDSDDELNVRFNPDNSIKKTLSANSSTIQTSRSCSNLNKYDNSDENIPKRPPLTPVRAPPCRPPPPKDYPPIEKQEPSRPAPPNPPPRINAVQSDTNESIEDLLNLGPIITISENENAFSMPPRRPDPPPRAHEIAKSSSAYNSPKKAFPPVPPRPL